MSRIDDGSFIRLAASASGRFVVVRESRRYSSGPASKNFRSATVWDVTLGTCDCARLSRQRCRVAFAFGAPGASVYADVMDFLALVRDIDLSALEASEARDAE